MNLIKSHRCKHLFYKNQIPFFHSLFRNLIFCLCNSSSTASRKIEKNSLFGYDERTVIGNSCSNEHTVTLRGEPTVVNIPVVVNYVYFSNEIRIIVPLGNRVFTGKNAVLMLLVNEIMWVIGIQAEVLKGNIIFNQYV